MLKPNSILAIDFDGTCVTHEFPKIGRDIGAQRVLKRLVAAGHRLILWTMRSSGRADGTDPLGDAVAWFAKNAIPLFGINGNPEQSSWTGSPKAYAHLYVDDAALGAPLLPGLKGEKPFLDWLRVERMLFPDESMLKREVLMRTIDHPEANGRKPISGDVAFDLRFPLEDNRELVVAMGELGFDRVSQIILDNLAGTPSYSDGSTNMDKK